MEYYIVFKWSKIYLHILTGKLLRYTLSKKANSIKCTMQNSFLKGLEVNMLTCKIIDKGLIEYNKLLNTSYFRGRKIQGSIT